MKKNYLKNEKSYYLQQHASNPINWFPWGKKAIEKAKKENKIIILSIGYSSCHWCHVMEKETFQNEIIAKQIEYYGYTINQKKRKSMEGKIQRKNTY